jgi:sodium-coupled neutral amino acid transporter 5
MNLVKTCLGSGILALPHAFAGAGLVWAIAFLFLSAVLSSFSLFLLGDVSVFGGRNPTLPGVGHRALRSSGRMLANLSVCFNNIGAMTSYLIVASTSLLTVIGAENSQLIALPFLSARQVLVLLAVTLISPLCFVRRVNVLRFSSALGICALLYVMAMVLAFQFAPHLDPCTPGVPCKGDVVLSTNDSVGIFTQFVQFTNAYTCHYMMIPLVNELQAPTRTRKAYLAIGSTATSAILYGLVATAGYLTFGDLVKSDILLSYPVDSVLVTVARVAITMDVLSSYPLLMYTTRIAIAGLFRECACSRETNTQTTVDGTDNTDDLSEDAHTQTTVDGTDYLSEGAHVDFLFSEHASLSLDQRAGQVRPIVQRHTHTYTRALTRSRVCPSTSSRRRWTSLPR